MKSVTLIAASILIWSAQLAIADKATGKKDATDSHPVYKVVKHVEEAPVAKFTAEIHPIVIKGSKFFDSVTKDQFYVKGYTSTDESAKSFLYFSLLTFIVNTELPISHGAWLLPMQTPFLIPLPTQRHAKSQLNS